MLRFAYCRLFCHFHVSAHSHIYVSLSLFSAKRGMNGDIILRKVKLAPSQVASMIDNMDAGQLDAVELKSLYEFMPTDEESKGLTEYLAGVQSCNDGVAEMMPCKQYMVVS